LRSYTLKIRQSSRREFLLRGFATLSTTLVLKACRRDFSSAQAPTPRSTERPTLPSFKAPMPSASPEVPPSPSPTALTSPSPLASTPPSPTAPTPPSLGESSRFLQSISVPSIQGQKPAGLIVCLHGNGSTPEYIASFAPVLYLLEYQLLFPSAPFSHPSVPGGKMWYDLTLQDNKPKILNYQRLAESRQRLTNWLKSLEGSTGIPLSRTILIGFSQGGAMTLDVGLTLPLARLVCLSGYLHSKPKPTIRKPFPPVLMVHGRQDQIILLREAHRARDTLSSWGVSVNYKEIDMGHEVRPEVLTIMRQFILDAFKK
jgi:phospholipase/carboxylesterase